MAQNGNVILKQQIFCNLQLTDFILDSKLQLSRPLALICTDSPEMAFFNAISLFPGGRGLAPLASPDDHHNHGGLRGGRPGGALWLCTGSPGIDKES